MKFFPFYRLTPAEIAHRYVKNRFLIELRWLQSNNFELSLTNETVAMLGRPDPRGRYSIIQGDAFNIILITTDA